MLRLPVLLCAALLPPVLAFPSGRASILQMTQLRAGAGPSTDDQSSNSAVQNFRQAASLPGIYRCASTDGLAKVVLDAVDGPEHILLNRAGLILDLRSQSERDEASARCWMERAPHGGFIVEDFERGSALSDASQEMRRVLRIDVLSPSRLFDHLTAQWMSPSQKALAAMYYAIDGGKLHELRMDVLNEKGLAGLYEAIISTSGEELKAGLTAITEYLEACEAKGVDGACAVHCVQGKDRTGLLIMLCQSMMGVSDDEIIADYHLLDTLRKRDEGSAAADQFGGKVKRKGKLDRLVFSGAPMEAMIETLAWIRDQYGSINPGYLESIGFDQSWRDRFVEVVSKKSSASVDVPLSKL